MIDKKITLYAVLPNGEVVVRTTSHDYKYVVYSEIETLATGDRKFHAILWTTRIDLAEARIRAGASYVGVRRRETMLVRMAHVPTTKTMPTPKKGYTYEVHGLNGELQLRTDDPGEMLDFLNRPRS